MTPTIQQALIDCITEENKLGTGSHISVYGLDSIGLNNYVLRVRAEEPYYASQHLRQLKASTALTPMGELATGANVGQPLLQIDKNAWIMVRQSGVTLSAYKETHRPDYSDLGKAMATLSLIDEVLQAHQRTQINPFLALAAEFKGLIDHKYLPDINKKNILWDGTRFGLVDQIITRKIIDRRDAPPSVTPRLDSVLSHIGTHNLREHLQQLPDPAKAQASLDSFMELFNEAREKAEARQIKAAVTFAKVNTAKIGNALTLADTPAALKTQLDALRTQALGVTR